MNIPATCAQTEERPSKKDDSKANDILMDDVAELIWKRAFEITKARGDICGPDIRDWLQAEDEILAEAGQPCETQKRAISP